MKNFFKKFGSRKFLITFVSVISGILTMANCDDSLIQFICSLIMIIAPALTYIITEGVLDYTSIGLALEEVVEIINKYIETKKELEGKNNKENTEEVDEAELIEETIEFENDGTIKEGIIIDLK